MAAETLEHLVTLSWDNIAHFINDNVSDPIKASCLATLINICRRNPSEIIKWREEVDIAVLQEPLEQRILSWFNFSDAIQQRSCWKFNMRALEFLATEKMEYGSEIIAPEFSFFIHRIPEILVKELGKSNYIAIREKDRDFYDTVTAYIPDKAINFDSIPTATLFNCDALSCNTTDFADNLRDATSSTDDAQRDAEISAIIADEIKGYNTTGISGHELRVLVYILLNQKVGRIQSELDFLRKNADNVSLAGTQEYLHNIEIHEQELQEATRRCARIMHE